MRRQMTVQQEAGVTVPMREPELLRVVSNGKASGAGIRIYVPKATVAEYRLVSGQHYRFERLEDGRIRLHKVDVAVHAAEPAAAGTLPSARLTLHLTAEEARAVEVSLVDGERTARDLLLQVAKRLRRRARLHGFAIPDRTDDKLEHRP